jgi:hypothetical protein
MRADARQLAARATSQQPRRLARVGADLELDAFQALGAGFALGQRGQRDFEFSARLAELLHFIAHRAREFFRRCFTAARDVPGVLEIGGARRGQIFLQLAEIDVVVLVSSVPRAAARAPRAVPQA